MARPKPATVALRDQMLAIMRDAQAPLSTNEIIARCPMITSRWRPRLDEPAFLQRYEVVERPRVVGEWVYLRRPMQMDVYPQLRALEVQGLCQRIWIPGDRSVYWTTIKLE